MIISTYSIFKSFAYETAFGLSLGGYDPAKHWGQGPVGGENRKYIENHWGQGPVGGENRKYTDIPFSVPIQFIIPSTPLRGTILLTGNLNNIQDTNAELSVVGFKPVGGFNPSDLKLGSDYTIKQSFTATIENMIRQISGNTITDIDKGKEWINNAFGIQIGPVASLKMDLSIKLPIPNTLTDVSQIQNIIPIPSAVIWGCYNKMSNNLPDPSNIKGTVEIIEDHNTAINQEDKCTQLL